MSAKTEKDQIAELLFELSQSPEHGAKVMVATLTQQVEADNQARLEVKAAAAEIARWRGEQAEIDRAIKQVVPVCAALFAGKVPDPALYQHLGQHLYADALAKALLSQTPQREQAWGVVLNDLVHRRSGAAGHYAAAVNAEARAEVAADVARRELKATLNQAHALARKLRPVTSKRVTKRARRPAPVQPVTPAVTPAPAPAPTVANEGPPGVAA